MPRKRKTLARNEKTPRFLAKAPPCLNMDQKNVTLHSNFLICQAMQKSAKKRAGTQRYTGKRAKAGKRPCIRASARLGTVQCVKHHVERAKKSCSEGQRSGQAPGGGGLESPLSLFSLLLKCCANGTRPVKCISCPLLVFTLSCSPRRPYARARARAG